MRGEREKERGEDLVVHPCTEGGVGPEVGVEYTLSGLYPREGSRFRAGLPSCQRILTEQEVCQ